MLYRSIRFVYFMHKTADLTGAGYAVFGCFADPMRFLEKLLDIFVASSELKEDVSVCVHVMAGFHVPWGRGSQVWFELYALGS